MCVYFITEEFHIFLQTLVGIRGLSRRASGPYELRVQVFQLRVAFTKDTPLTLRLREGPIFQVMVNL